MAEAVGLAAGRDLGEGLGHDMQAKGVKLVEGWMFKHLIVVARTTDVGMQDRRSVRGALLRGTPVEVVIEDGFHRTVGTSADVDGAVRRRLETSGTIRTGQTNDPQTSAKALFWM